MASNIISDNLHLIPKAVHVDFDEEFSQRYKEKMMASDESFDPAPGMSAEEQREFLHQKPAKVTEMLRQTLTADEQIRMKALECASIIASGFASQPGAIGMRDDGEFWSKLEKFEDYLRNGRD